ncbi:LysR family transcriptional regulator [Alcanivorax sp. 1008]|uniref:LysR family transcriptional regulator n=1 Tax=Alcanivorax sp. 1008 TaxID=2816853 RepID=UPI001D94EC75|nr:LysR family transcriptional regulator [Alcanivorax sp. 1008]MCC1495476.1 LysR family transcriptional regulator [Alcanivorax sp. 1008]
MKYTLRQLEVFLAIARQQHLTRAAESLAMSQSAASSALRELEQQFSIRLFDRVGKRLQLNESGQLIRPRAEALLAEAMALQQSLDVHSEAGRLKVGATLTIGNYLAVGIMARYMNEPGTGRVSLDVGNTEEIAAKVANFEADIGLIEGELHHPDILLTPWQDDELVVFCAPDHSLAGRPALDDRDLLEATWIVREPGSGTRQTFNRALHGLLPQLNILLELQHTEAIKRAVEAGLGIGCLSKVTLTEAFRRGSLVPLPVPGRDFQRQFYFALHRHKYVSAGIERWVSLCRETAAGSRPPSDAQA